MKIGLLSDTHSYLDPKVLTTLKTAMKSGMPVTLVTEPLLDELEKIKPLRAVYGNIDDKDIQVRYPEDLWFSLRRT